MRRLILANSIILVSIVLSVAAGANTDGWCSCGFSINDVTYRGCERSIQACRSRCGPNFVGWKPENCSRRPAETPVGRIPDPNLPAGTQVPAGFDWGYSSERVWIDFDGDNITDYARRVGNNAAMSLTAPDEPGQEAIAVSLRKENRLTEPYILAWTRWGGEFGRAWTDLNGDRRVDYCRVLATDSATTTGRLACTLSNGNGFGGTVYYPTAETSFDAGYHAGRYWTDANGDGNPDYCRVIGNHPGGTFISCVLWSPDTGSFAEDKRFDNLNGSLIPAFLR